MQRRRQIFDISQSARSTHLCSRRMMTSRGFKFCSRYLYAIMVGLNLPTKLVKISIQSFDIDVFRNGRWRPTPFWIFKLSECGTFAHVGNLVLKLCTKFGLNIPSILLLLRSSPFCWWRSFDDVTRINFRFRFLVIYNYVSGPMVVSQPRHGSGGNWNFHVTFPYLIYWQVCCILNGDKYFLCSTLIWNDAHVSMERVASLTSHQRINHLTGLAEICNKDRFVYNLTRSAPWCLTVTLANVDRFSNLYHQWIGKKILYVYAIKISISPTMCCYTT